MCWESQILSMQWDRWCTPHMESERCLSLPARPHPCLAARGHGSDISHIPWKWLSAIICYGHGFCLLESMLLYNMEWNIEIWHYWKCFNTLDLSAIYTACCHGNKTCLNLLKQKSSALSNENLTVLHFPHARGVGQKLPDNYAVNLALITRCGPQQEWNWSAFWLCN